MIWTNYGVDRDDEVGRRVSMLNPSALAPRLNREAYFSAPPLLFRIGKFSPRVAVFPRPIPAQAG